MTKEELRGWLRGSRAYQEIPRPRKFSGLGMTKETICGWLHEGEQAFSLGVATPRCPESFRGTTQRAVPDPDLSAPLA